MSEEPAPSNARNWRDQLEERQRKDLAFAELYAREFNHGTVGHNQFILISRLAELLDVAAGIREPSKPPDPADIKLTFGKYSHRTLGQLLAEDPKYLGWLSDEAHDTTLRAAARAVLATRSRPTPAPQRQEPEPVEPGEDLPF